MPQRIVQFQVVVTEHGHIIYALQEDGKLFFKNPAVGNGAWQEVN